MNAMLAWIDENSDYEASGLPLPEITLVTHEDLQIQYYGRLPGPNEAFLEVQGIYYDDTKSMWLRDTFDINSPQWRAYLLHELVHHAQAFSDREWPCVAASEVDAYRLGDQYAVEILKDESLKSDALTVAFISQCARRR